MTSKYLHLLHPYFQIKKQSIFVCLELKALGSIDNPIYHLAWQGRGMNAEKGREMQGRSCSRNLD